MSGDAGCIEHSTLNIEHSTFSLLPGGRFLLRALRFRHQRSLGNGLEDAMKSEMLNVECSVSNVGRTRTALNTQHSTLNIQHSLYSPATASSSALSVSGTSAPSAIALR